MKKGLAFIVLTGVISLSIFVSSGNLSEFIKASSQKKEPIDPSQINSTYLGSGDGDHSGRVAVDASGNIYVVGTTWHSPYSPSDFPITPGAFDTTFNGDHDVVISKFDPTCSTLIYSTFLGGSSNEWGRSIAVDSQGYATITGSTQSSDFPVTTGAYDRQLDGESDVFVAKLDPQGSDLVFATFLGGSGEDIGRDLALDKNGNVYITGSTYSQDFPVTLSAFDQICNSTGYRADAFVAKFDPFAQELVYSTYLGGEKDDYGNGIAVDINGKACVTGETRHSDFPVTVGGFDTTYNGEYEVFVTQINPDGSDLAYSTYIGGSSFDIGHSVALDESGNACVTGYTSSADFPITPGAYLPPSRGHIAAFVFKLDATGSSLVFSLIIGGSQVDRATDIAVDFDGYVCVTGSTNSFDFPVTSLAYDRAINGSQDIFVTKIHPRGTHLVYSTFLGGEDNDWGSGITLNKGLYCVVVGKSLSTNFPTSRGAFAEGPIGLPDVTITSLPLIFKKKGTVRR